MPILHIVLFLSLVILAYLGMQYYVAFWLIRSFPGLPLSPAAVRCAVLAPALLFPLSIAWLRSGGTPAHWLAYAMYVWTGILLIWLAWALAGDAGLLLAGRLGARAAAGPFIARAVLAATALSSAYAYWNASRLPAVETVEVALPRLPKALDGLSVVQLSDLHLGVTVPVRRFERIVDEVNALQPDLIALTGDLLDPGPLGEAEVAAIGSRMKARLGKFAVLGNHEFYHGIDKAAVCFGRCGARLLRNEVVELPGGLQLAGVDDIMASRLTKEEFGKILAKLDASKPSILLSHQPRLVEDAAAAGVGLMLSGHTHRGQIFPFWLLVRMFYRYVYGPYRVDGMSLYVSCGAGEWGPPMRFLTRAEIVRLVLRAPS